MPHSEQRPSAREASSFEHGVLGELPSTAICGNDITSSCLYVSALAIIAAGQWAPLALLIVAGVLFLYRRIYAEVVGALPLNGGAYNALLNTTSKFRASIAACLTILSYMATAVISASEAMHYAHSLWPGLHVIGATIGLLGLFMVLSILGITESAAVAVGIFVFHLVTLTLLLFVGGYHIAASETGFETLTSNFNEPLAEGNLSAALFFGFCAAMLGISGFESSSNFVEEQKEGVFPKTLRNMWIAVSVFNPLMALLALSLIHIPDVKDHKEALLAHMGEISGGGWFSTLISVDAILVLSGAVLTSFVGVNGLVRRMTLDRCLPQFLLKTNGRGTTHRIIITFFVLAVSVLLITEGELDALAGVYLISFLSVMALFALGNVLLKVSRARLPRPVQASWLSVLVAVAAVLAGLAGNIVKHPDYFAVFLQYFVPAMIVILVMLERISLLKACLFFVRIISSSISKFMHNVAASIRTKIDQINSQQMVFFTRGDDIANLNNAMLYVKRNEQTNRIKFVTVVDKPEDVPEKLAEEIHFLDEAYPEIDIEFVVIEGTFGPEMIQQLSDEWGIPTNLMFIGSHGGTFEYNQAKLGGVRLII